ncbi:MAG: iron-containing alcohol dehydrogenase [Bdellovibrionales bacterium]|nr:iron-containing alcohol dehydrogenase [Bdellovibrionales bacterium]
MNSFVFYNPTKIYFGSDKYGFIAKEIPKNSKVLLIFGGGSIKNNGVYDRVIKSLSGFEVVEFGGVHPNPTYEYLYDAIRLCKTESIDFILAVGGGSVVDASKFVAAATFYDGDPWDLLKKKSVVERSLPIGVVLTLPATGSEMNAGAVVTKEETQEKLGFFSIHSFPKFSILDPQATFSLPYQQRANGISDAFIHILEQYLTYSVGASVQDRLAEGLLSTLIDQGPRTLENPEDYTACANIMWASTLALNGLIGCGVPQDWTTHILGHELTAKFGISHAESLTSLIIHVWKERFEEKKEKLAQYAIYVWGFQANDLDSNAKQAIDKTRLFFQSLSMKTDTSHLNMSMTDIDNIVRRLEQRKSFPLGEKKTVDKDLCRKILISSRNI